MLLFILFTKFALANEIAQWPLDVRSNFDRQECPESAELVTRMGAHDAKSRPAWVTQRMIEVCGIAALKRKVNEAPQTLCPRVISENFHICYRRTLDSLLKENKLSITGLVLFSEVAPARAVQQKLANEGSPIQRNTWLLENLVATLEIAKHVPNAETTELKEVEQLIARSLAKNIIDAADKLMIQISSQKKRATTSNSLLAWHRDISRRLKILKSSWKYPDASLEADHDKFKKQ